MTKKITIVDKCVDWNAARYDQVYNYNLANELLKEELNELEEAKTTVDKLDAIGDITFVAIGILWKLGCSKEVLNSLFYDKDLSTATIEELEEIVYRTEKKLTFYGTDKIGSDRALYAIFGVCFNELIKLNLQKYFYDIVDAICESNNTKRIEGKTAPSIKANIDKGKSYVSPTKALKQIIADAKRGEFI